MADIPIGDPGLAGGVTQESFRQYEIWISEQPAIFGVEVELLGIAATTYALYSVVKFNADGRVSGLANNVSGAHADGARGIIAGKVTAGAVGTNDVSAFVYQGGNPNIDILVWHAATFPATAAGDLLKLSAFKGAPAPIQIVPGLNRFNRKT